MSATLADKVAAWVNDHPESTVEEIARAVGRNTSAVRLELRSGPYTVQPGPRGAWLYTLSAAVSARPVKSQRPSGRRGPSQADQLLGILADGRWHTTRELLQAVPCIVHSRVAELRSRRGLTIEHETDGVGAAGSRYRLVAPLEQSPAPNPLGQPGARPALSGAGGCSSGAPATDGGQRGGAARQLSLDETVGA